MAQNTERIGVCVVRVERRRAGVSITVITNPDIETPATERRHRTTDIAEALALIETFIDDLGRERSS